MRLILLGFLLFLASCGSKDKGIVLVEGGRQFETSNPVFNEFTDHFTAMGLLQGIPSVDISNIPINFGDVNNIPGANLRTRNHSHKHGSHCEHKKTDKAEYHFAKINRIDRAEVVGVCISYSDDSREILIDERLWNDFTREEKEILVFHELGHCFGNRSHKSEKRFGIDLSMMAPTIINPSDYLVFYDLYMIELFTENHGPLYDRITEGIPRHLR